MRETIAGIWADDWVRVTHLEGLDIAGLVRHVLDGINQFSRLAAGDGFDADVRVEVDAIDVALRFDEIAGESVARWGAADALTATYSMPWGQEHGERLAAYLIVESIGHAWDLATALGRELAISDELADTVLEVAQSFSEETLRARGMFGPEQGAPADAKPIVRLVSFLGRTATASDSVG